MENQEENLEGMEGKNAEGRRCTGSWGWIGVVAGVALLVAGCHTWVFQPVKKNIQGLWQKTPIDPSLPAEVWEFTSNEVIIWMEDTTTGTFQEVYRTPYTVKLKPGHHVVVAKLPPLENVTMEWYVVKGSRKRLYLAIKREESQGVYNGNYQHGFYRYSGTLPRQ